MGAEEGDIRKTGDNHRRTMRSGKGLPGPLEAGAAIGHIVRQQHPLPREVRIRPPQQLRRLEKRRVRLVPEADPHILQGHIQKARRQIPGQDAAPFHSHHGVKFARHPRADPGHQLVEQNLLRRPLFHNGLPFLPETEPGEIPDRELDQKPRDTTLQHPQPPVHCDPLMEGDKEEPHRPGGGKRHEEP